ncbi:T9SS type A sorting domain-containing protein [candidate division KSB1 bacterium]|nr:T9SS type A sorting domain-containing protein [candidate division KSB1 bacterium]
MKLSLFFFVLAFLLSMPPGGAENFDPIQSRAIERAPHIQQTIQAYLYRLGLDDDPHPAIREFVGLLYRVYPEFDAETYTDELIARYDAAAASNPKTEGFKATAAIGTEIKVNDSDADCWDVSAALSQKSSLLFAVWQDERHGLSDPDIYGQFFDTNMNPYAGNFITHTFLKDIAQIHPAVTALSDGGFVVAWEDYRHGASAIYACRFYPDRSQDVNEFRVHGSVDAQLKPAIAADDMGRFIIVWLQLSSSDYDVYARVFNNNTTSITEEFRVNDNVAAFQWFPVVAMAASGETFIVWEDKRDGNSNIYAQRLRSDGSKRGGNFRVDDAVGNATQWQPAVAAGPDNFIVTWEDYRDNPDGIYAQWYDGSMLADGFNRRVDDFAISSLKERPDVAINASGESVFCWQDGRGEAYHVCAQTYDAQKNANAFISLADLGESTEQRFPKIVIQNRLLSFFWINKEKTRDTHDTYANQIIWIDIPVELAFFDARVVVRDVLCSWTTLSETANLGFIMEKSCDGTSFSEIGFVAGKGSSAHETHYTFIDKNVAAGDYFYRLKQIDFDGTSSLSHVVQVSVQCPESMRSLVNYPNPFNPATTIVYRVQDRDRVRLQIFDLSGRIVNTLVDDDQEPGEYTIVWNGVDVDGIRTASGLYFCKLVVGDISVTKKMILAQ